MLLVCGPTAGVDTTCTPCQGSSQDGCRGAAVRQRRLARIFAATGCGAAIMMGTSSRGLGWNDGDNGLGVVVDQGSRQLARLTGVGRWHD